LTQSEVLQRMATLTNHRLEQSDNGVAHVYDMWDGRTACGRSISVSSDWQDGWRLCRQCQEFLLRVASDT